MQKFVFFIVCCMVLITGCSDKYFSSNIDLTETTDQIDTETSTGLAEDISMTTVTAEQYLRDNIAAENACSAILKELPPVMKGKWLVSEEFGLKAVGRIGEESQGNIIEFSAGSIKVNDEAL